MKQETENIILDADDVYNMLDTILQPKTDDWWSQFYKKRKHQIPFMVDKPSENLIAYVTNKNITGETALDIGCGNGRNTRFLSKNGFKTTGIDFSQESIKIALELSKNSTAHFVHTPFEKFAAKSESFDFIYDAGCLHHIPPHRRPAYLKKIHSLLKTDGKYALEVFNEKGGSGLSDYDVYTERSMQGGLGYSEDKLKAILAPHFKIVNIREMKNCVDETAYGLDTLWTVLVEKTSTPL